MIETHDVFHSPFKAANEDLPDQVRLDRLRRQDLLSRNLDDRKYAEFTKARQVNFLGYKMKYQVMPQVDAG